MAHALSGSPRMVTGRGGALKSKVYTTGRGGSGKMTNIELGEEAREAQDVDVPSIMLPECQKRMGWVRNLSLLIELICKAHNNPGGAANVHKPIESMLKANKQYNEKVRSESFEGGSRRINVSRAFWRREERLSGHELRRSVV